MGFFREFFKLLDYWRRSLIEIFDKDYVKNKLKKRKGHCKKCGRCCRGCPELDNKTKLCRVYNNRNPFMCHIDFPLDKLDQKLFGVEKTCGYKFN